MECMTFHNVRDKGRWERKVMIQRGKGIVGIKWRIQEASICQERSHLMQQSTNNICLLQLSQARTFTRHVNTMRSAYDYDWGKSPACEFRQSISRWRAYQPRCSVFCVLLQAVVRLTHNRWQYLPLVHGSELCFGAGWVFNIVLSNPVWYLTC